MGKVRSPVYSHYSEDPIKGLYSCLYCAKTIAFSSGTSNMHKHLKIFHPDVDRYGAGGNGCPIIYEGDYALVEEDADTTQVDTSEETAPQVIQAPAKKRKPNVVRPKQEEISYIDVGSAEITTVATDASDVNQYDDHPSRKMLLKRIKQITSDHAELSNQVHQFNADLQNDILQQQYESQEQLQMIRELRRELNQIKKARQNHHQISEQEEHYSDESILRFPIYRMQQIDDIERRIAEDHDFKERLGEIFKEGKGQKVESILSWISKEILTQFTYKNDPDSLTTHRATDLSEIFQLMFSVWTTTNSFTEKEFRAVIKQSLEMATCQLSAENCENNKRKRELSEMSEMEEPEMKAFIKMQT